MLEPKRDYITFSNWVAWLAAAAAFAVIAVHMPNFEMLWFPLVVAFFVVVLVTFGLNQLLQSAGGFGGLALAIMSTVSFAVAVMQLVLWFRDWPFKP